MFSADWTVIVCKSYYILDPVSFLLLLRIIISFFLILCHLLSTLFPFVFSAEHDWQKTQIFSLPCPVSHKRTQLPASRHCDIPEVFALS